MNNLFNNNINSLKDIAIKEKLTNHTCVIKPILTMTNGYNLSYDNKVIHSEENPLIESKQIFDASKNEENSFVIIYGLGLGYLFQIAAQQSKGTILLFEPNFDIISEAFSLVDFSKELKKTNIHMFTDINNLIKFISEHATSDTKVEILSLPSYREMYKQEFEQNTKTIELAFGSIILDYGFKENRMFQVTENMLTNIPKLLDEVPLNKYENIYNGKTAIIVSAGPTLGENIETLKKYQKNAIIFAVGPSIKTLVNNNINVDFLCMIESNNIIKQVNNIDLSNINLIVEPNTNINVHNLDAKNKILHIPENMPSSQYFADIIGVSTKGYYTQGTVSFAALNSAVKMGFKKIILVGQDLAYIDGQCYSKGSAYEDLVCKLNPETNKYEIMAKDFDKYMNLFVRKNDDEKRKAALERLMNLNKILYTVKSIDGNMIPTEAGYASFIIHFENYAKELPDVQIINTSMKGALIRNMENLSLEEAIKDSTPIDRVELSRDYNYDLELIIKNIQNEHKKILSITDIIENSRKLLSKLKMISKRNKAVDKEKLLKIRELLENYANLNNDNNLLFKYITTKEDISFKSIYKKIKTYDEKTYQIALTALDEYYGGIAKKTDTVQTILNNLIEGIKE